MRVRTALVSAGIAATAVIGTAATAHADRWYPVDEFGSYSACVRGAQGQEGAPRGGTTPRPPLGGAMNSVPKIAVAGALLAALAACGGRRQFLYDSLFGIDEHGAFGHRMSITEGARPTRAEIVLKSSGTTRTAAARTLTAASVGVGYVATTVVCLRAAWRRSIMIEESR